MQLLIKGESMLLSKNMNGEW